MINVYLPAKTRLGIFCEDDRRASVARQFVNRYPFLVDLVIFRYSNDVLANQEASGRILDLCKKKKKKKKRQS